MRYAMQIAGWLVAGVISITLGYAQGQAGLGYRFAYLGVMSIAISALTYYLTNMTDLVDRLMLKNSANRKRSA